MEDDDDNPVEYTAHACIDILRDVEILSDHENAIIGVLKLRLICLGYLALAELVTSKPDATHH